MGLFRRCYDHCFDMAATTWFAAAPLHFHSIRSDSDHKSVWRFIESRNHFCTCFNRTVIRFVSHFQFATIFDQIMFVAKASQCRLTMLHARVLYQFVVIMTLNVALSSHRFGCWPITSTTHTIWFNVNFSLSISIRLAKQKKTHSTAIELYIKPMQCKVKAPWCMRTAEQEKCVTKSKKKNRINNYKCNFNWNFQSKFSIEIEKREASPPSSTWVDKHSEMMVFCRIRCVSIEV